MLAQRLPTDDHEAQTAGRTLRFVITVCLLSCLTAVPLGLAGQSPATAETALLPLTDFSPAMLGMYRKVLEIDGEIQHYSSQYGLDPDLARAVALQESGGNAALVSVAGANGYFQVMPATFRSLGVETNIEAGIKYLARQVRRFGREDYALAAYNGGPSRVSRGRPMFLETLQYVVQISDYRNALKLYGPSLRHHALGIRLERVSARDTWLTLSQRLSVPILQLRLHNPFLATHALHPGQLIAYPSVPRDDLFQAEGETLLYRTRHGDNYLRLAFSMQVDLELLRETNQLWRLQSLPVGQLLRIPLTRDTRFAEYQVQPTDTLETIATSQNTTPWRLIRDNGLWDDRVTPGMRLRIQPEAPKPALVTYQVSRGDTLGRIAARHGTTVRAIQAANRMERRTVIKIGQRLLIPSTTN